MSELDDNILFDAVEATAPTATTPSYLDPEATKPMPPPVSLADRLAQGKTAADMGEGDKPKRKPGRPPGSKNRATLARESQEGVNRNSPQKMVVPPPRQTTKKDDGLTPEQRHEAKLARAEKLTVTVVETINDNLMLGLIAMGAPSSLIYKPGREPKGFKEDTPYTDFAQSLVLSPMQAGFIGRFLAEMEATDTGGKIGSVVTDGKGPMIIYGLLSLAGLIQWGKGLSDTYKQFGPLLEQYKAQQRIHEQQQQTTGG